MSRAFVKESDSVDDLPDRLISPHPNLVTREGLAQIEREVARLSRLYAEAQAAADRDGLAVAARDLRYWTARLASAELVPPPQDRREVRFGAIVVLDRADGRRQTYQIVGEDEADPRAGTLSWVSPLAKALSGKCAGDDVSAGATTFTIVEIS